ncbi:MAG: hypothetical protein IK114_02070 [Fibrobacter sp.]|nr:hypothetical protein [Fibrobacter sp.]
MKYFGAIGTTVLLSLLYACAYLDGDGLSKSPEEVSYENIQGCYYAHKIVLRGGDSGYAYCDEICIHDSVAVIREKHFEDVRKTGEFFAATENESDWDTTYSREVVLPENEADGSYLYNLRIGKDDFIFEFDDYGKRLRGFADTMYLSIREVELCKD